MHVMLGSRHCPTPMSPFPSVLPSSQVSLRIALSPCGALDQLAAPDWPPSPPQPEWREGSIRQHRPTRHHRRFWSVYGVELAESEPFDSCTAPPCHCHCHCHCHSPAPPGQRTANSEQHIIRHVGLTTRARRTAARTVELKAPVPHSGTTSTSGDCTQVAT